VTPAALADLVRSLADDVLTSRGLDAAVLPAAVTVEPARNPDHGDYATSVALQAAGRAGVTPGELAGWLADALAATPGLRSAEVAGPGFVNMRLAPDAYPELLSEVLAAGERYGADREVAVQLARQVHQVGADAEIRIDHRAATMGELTELLGADTARHVLVRAEQAGGTVDVDLALWSARTDRNPVFSVQHAHARLTALIRNGADLGVVPAVSRDAEPESLGHDREGELIRMLAELPRVASSAAGTGRPALVARYLEKLARACHVFADSCPVLPVGDEEPSPRHAARLAVCQAARQVLANGLALLGVSALEQL
jgi:arginyl-tRNA synthetase